MFNTKYDVIKIMTCAKDLIYKVLNLLNLFIPYSVFVAKQPGLVGRVLSIVEEHEFHSGEKLHNYIILP
jgi:hypothetical protein